MDERQIDNYLIGDMSRGDREKFEDTFAGDDELFVEIAERENELVDTYVRGELDSPVLERFERSLDSLPARRQKVANARALNRFVEAEREVKTITIAERTELASRLADLFTFRSPIIRYAAIAAILLLALAATFLLYENRRLRSLQDELADARSRAAELTAQIETARETAGELTADLDRERERIASLERDIATLRGGDRDNPPTNAALPTIATLVLSPVSIRGGSSPPVRRLELTTGVTRVSIVISLPTETGEQVSVRLNGETVAENVRVRRRNGEKTISVVVPITRIRDQRNSIEIIDPSGKAAIEYPFSTIRK